MWILWNVVSDADGPEIYIESLKEMCNLIFTGLVEMFQCSASSLRELKTLDAPFLACFKSLLE